MPLERPLLGVVEIDRDTGKTKNIWLAEEPGCPPIKVGHVLSGPDKDGYYEVEF